MKKILITGLSGFLGHYLYKFRPYNVEITGTFFNNKPEFQKIELVHLDLSNVEKFLVSNKNKYDIIIHCAAESSLSKCEQDPKQAYKLNSDATKKLAQWSENQGSRFVFLSTDIVFDGKKGNYSENDIPDPINIYGKSKLEAERIINKIHNNAAIIRLALCLGKGLEKTHSFIDWLLAKLENNEDINLYYDEFRTPISAPIAAMAIWKIALSEYCGIIHLAGIEKIDRFNFGVKMLQHLKSEKFHLLQKISSSTSMYPRPKDVSMQTGIIKDMFDIQLENTDSIIGSIL